jgi:hypothetical protein
LLHQPAASGAERYADGDFALPGDAAGKQEVGDVDTCDQQNECDRRHQDENWQPDWASYLILLPTEFESRCARLGAELA